MEPDPNYPPSITLPLKPDRNDKFNMSINTTQEHAVRFVKPISPTVKAVERWTREAIEELFNLPFNDLLFKAQQVHREHFNPNEVQLSTLLSIKTGGCPEDCSYCPQSVHYNTGV